MKKTVLFVCTENLFRSASAEILFKKLLLDKKDNSFSVISAGTKATDNWGMYPQTRSRIEFYGGNLESYYQKKLTKEMVLNANYIICMTSNHKTFVKNNFGVDAYLFNELAYGKSTDLEDDDEACGKYSSLTQFVNHTVDTIQNGLNNIYDQLN